MSDAEMRELIIGLAPRTAHSICDELEVTQAAIRSLIGDESIPADVRFKIALIQSRTQGAADIARQFLYITGNKEPPRAVVDVRELVLEIEPLIQRLLGDDIRLRLLLDCDLWPIKADADSLVSIFCALAANSQEAMFEGGTVCIRGARLSMVEGVTGPATALVVSDYLVIEFSDTGIGIPNHIADRIFDPFFSIKGPGRGFGLASVCSKIKKMNGHISVNSRLGCGTTVRLLLPRHFS